MVRKYGGVIVGMLGAALLAGFASLALSVSSGADVAGSCKRLRTRSNPVCERQHEDARSGGDYARDRQNASKRTHAANTSTTLGPVPRKVLVALGMKFTPARHARPNVHKQAGVHDALSTAPWPGCATGISLVRTEPSRRVPRGTLVWLVSIHPNNRVGPTSGGPPRHGPRARGHRLTANYAAVVVDARHGSFVESEDGYTKQLPPWRPLPPRGCEY